MTANLNAEVIAWASTLLCTYFSARCAKAFLIGHPRLFTVMALLALVWALLLPYYSHNIESELLPAYGGFILVYIGGLLTLEGKTKTGDPSKTLVSRNQSLGLWLFLLIAAPSFFALKMPEGAAIVSLSISQSELAIGTLLNVLGYWSITCGCRSLFGKRFFVLIASIFFVYSISEIGFTIWSFQHQRDAMPDGYRYLFSVLKLLVTGLLGYRISFEAFSGEERRRPVRTFSYKLLPWT